MRGRRGTEDYLFQTTDMFGWTHMAESTMRKEVEAWERNKVLGASESDLIEYLVDKYQLVPPVLRRDEMHIDSEGETRIDVSGRFEYGRFRDDGPHHVPGMYVTLAIPFDGDPDLFQFSPSTHSSMPPRGWVDGSEIKFTFADVKLEPTRLKAEIDGMANNIEEHLGWVRRDAKTWNDRVHSIALSAVKDRKRRLLENASMVSALGLPMKRRDAPANFAVPVVRKKKPVALPATPVQAFKPEPALLDAEYEYILQIIDRLALSIERSPKTFEKQEEENIRDLILVDLNGHYDGDATGETFNAQGKTDILIRADGRNAFIGECKIWTGQKAFLAAIDQILGYLTWRDTKASLMIFSKNTDFTKVLKEIDAAVPIHPNFKREVKKVSETHRRYILRQKNDPDREIHLAVQAFNIPRPEKA